MKLLIWLLMAVMLSINSAVFAAANPFTDMPAGHWAYNAVTTLTAKGLFTGYGDATFRGDRNITRYETATILAKVLRAESADVEFDDSKVFADVPESHWASESVRFTAGVGVNKGYDDNTFRGDRYITRYEMAQMLSKAFKMSDETAQIKAFPFSDVSKEHWAAGSVVSLASMGIIEGYGDGTFRGERNITRYEAAHMIAKSMHVIH